MILPYTHSIRLSSGSVDGVVVHWPFELYSLFEFLQYKQDLPFPGLSAEVGYDSSQ